MSNKAKMFLPLLLVAAAAFIAAFTIATHPAVDIQSDFIYWFAVDISAIAAFLLAAMAMRKHTAALSTVAFIGFAVTVVFTVWSNIPSAEESFYQYIGWSYYDVIAPIVLVVLAVNIIMRGCHKQ